MDCRGILAGASSRGGAAHYYRIYTKPHSLGSQKSIPECYEGIIIAPALESHQKRWKKTAKLTRLISFKSCPHAVDTRKLREGVE